MKHGEKKLRDLGALELATRIYEIGLLTGQSGTLDDVIQAMVQRILQETDASYVGIGLIDAGRRMVEHRWGVLDDGRVQPQGHCQPIGRGVVGQVAATGQSLCLDDVQTFSDYFDVVPGMRSEAAVPLKIGERIIGVLDAESRDVGVFGPASLAMLQALATPVAQAIQNARVVQEERRRANQLTMLNRVSRILTSTMDLDELLERTVEMIRELMDYDLVAVGLLDASGERVVLRAASSRARLDLPIGHSHRLGQGVTGEVVRSGRSLLIPDVQEWPNYISALSTIRCEMCCPLRAGNESFGFLDAESNEPGAFDGQDLLLLETLADHISKAVANVQNLERINQMRDELSSMVVHDLRSPISVIRSSLDMLEPRLADPEGSRSYLARAQSACDEMLVLIGGLLDLRKLESGEIELKLDPCSAGDLAREVKRRMAVVAEVREITLEVEEEQGLPMARLDLELITRVLENLAANALKYTPAGGQVTIEACRAPEQVARERLSGAATAVLYRVSDTGPGIPAEARERIFDKFAVLESRQAGRGPSTGLGLNFCKQAVSAHGGAIWVESGGEQGSVFCVLLPADG